MRFLQTSYIPKAILTLLVLTALGLLSPVFVHAQDDDNPVCNPPCAADQDCSYVGSGTQTQCFAQSTTDADGNTTVDPVTVTASSNSGSGVTFAQIVDNIVVIVSGGLIPLLYVLAILYVMYGIVRYFFIEGGEEGQQKGRKTILYGLIGIVVIFAVWGLVNILLNTLNSVADTNGTGTNLNSTTNSNDSNANDDDSGTNSDDSTTNKDDE